ncbi:hypothetical protein NLU13_7285 [Sarocladium strictum]|uniref:Uncharacterized protein n=1 Tax=Sarocladium strictum TaxID=5046 RepID=A0AA39GEX0_SARSR|nr:hypothetical protein NLU13_7285 [Sarocladium strictum]
MQPRYGRYHVVFLPDALVDFRHLPQKVYSTIQFPTQCTATTLSRRQTRTANSNMILPSSSAALAVATLLCSSFALAAPSNEAPRVQTARVSRADDGGNDGGNNGNDNAQSDAIPVNTPPPVILEPIVPPEVKETDLSIFDLDKNVTLAWAGATSGAAPGSKFKREAAVLTQGDFKFQYPTIALDHSSLVDKISCSGGQLSVVLKPDAYSYAKGQWASVKTLLLVTGVDGCGVKDANEYFKATAINFSDKDFSFTAQGSSVNYKDVVLDMKLQWGDAGNQPLKRAVDKRDLFEARGLEARKYASFTVSWSAYLNDKWALGVDPDAPWDNAARLFRWNKDGGRSDNARNKGKAKAKQNLKSKSSKTPSSTTKRSTRTKYPSSWIKDEKNKAAKAASDKAAKAAKAAAKATKQEKAKSNGKGGDLDVGLALYCVECGIRGQATIWGEVDASIMSMSVRTVKTGMKAEMHAGLNLGVDAYVKYDKTWKSKDFRIPLPGGFKIPLLLEVGPFLGFAVEANTKIAATGQLLIGGNVDWNDIDMTIDLLDTSQSSAKGFKPVFTQKVEAEGELEASASLGLPLKLGVAITIAGSWNAEAALKDTPSINAEGRFKGEYKKAADGTVTASADTCYGIDYNVFLGNNVDAYISGSKIREMSWPLMEPYRGPPIAQGCIGYLPEPTEEPTEEQTGEQTEEASQPAETLQS